jgi:amino acid transporter
MGTFRGVFVPAFIGLLGPTLFLRLPYVIAEAGFLLTLMMMALIGILCFFTISGANALLTNGRPRPGGAYLILSRNLGAELGASIGLILVARAHSPAVALPPHIPLPCSTC